MCPRAHSWRRRSSRTIDKASLIPSFSSSLTLLSPLSRMAVVLGCVLRDDRGTGFPSTLEQARCGDRAGDEGAPDRCNGYLSRLQRWVFFPSVSPAPLPRASRVCRWHVVAVRRPIRERGKRHEEELWRVPTHTATFVLDSDWVVPRRCYGECPPTPPRSCLTCYAATMSTSRW